MLITFVMQGKCLFKDISNPVGSGNKVLTEVHLCRRTLKRKFLIGGYNMIPTLFKWGGGGGG